MAYDNIKSLKNQDFTHTLSLSLSLSRRYTFGLSLSLSLEDTLLEKRRVRGGGVGGGGWLFKQQNLKQL